MHALILAGGFGTRLKSAVTDLPKPLAPIGGRPFLAWLIDALAAQGITGVTLSVHHQWEKIHDYFGRHPSILPIDYVVEPSPLGTGGAIVYALQKCPPEPVIVLNGDTFVQVDYKTLYEQHRQSKASMTMVLRKVADTGRYGEVVVQDDIVTSFQRGRPGQPGFINAGVYVLSSELFKTLPMPETFSFEQDFLEAHAGQIKPHSYIASDYFIDIGLPDDYARACRELPQLLGKAVA